MREPDPYLGALQIPAIPFRHNQGTSALLVSDKISTLTENKIVYKLYSVNFGFLIWVIAQGILGLIENQWDQVRVRNWTFRKLAGTTPKERRVTFISRLRYYGGKMIAGLYFLAALALALICPFVLVSSVIVNEINTWSLPVSESEDAVGQVSHSRVTGLLKIDCLTVEHLGRCRLRPCRRDHPEIP